MANSVPERFRRHIAAHGKSPWNPSTTAIGRVREPLPPPTVHSEGRGSSVEIAHHVEVYGKEYSDWPWMYRCLGCDAKVGMHPFTAIPLGTLADKEVRIWRAKAHDALDRVWQSGRMERSQAYGMMRREMGLSADRGHIGSMDVDQCRRVVRLFAAAPKA